MALICTPILLDNRRLAVAALQSLERPTEHMIDAAHEAVSFDDQWAINSRRDFRKAVRGMILAAMKEGDGGRQSTSEQDVHRSGSR